MYIDAYCLEDKHKTSSKHKHYYRRFFFWFVFVFCKAALHNEEINNS